MTIGARTAAWAKSGPTAKDYVQNGLVAMWDGIENAGWGVHDQNAIVWKDLSGNDFHHSLHDVSFDADCAKFVAGSYGLVDSQFISDNALTIEAVFAVEENVSAMIVQCGNGSGKSYGSQLCWHNSIGYITTSSNISTGGRFIFPESFSSASTVHAISESCNDVGFIDNLKRNNEELAQSGLNTNGGTAGVCVVGAQFYNSNYGYNSGRKRISNIRIYSRRLTDDERTANYLIDKARFNLPDAA